MLVRRRFWHLSDFDSQERILARIVEQIAGSSLPQTEIEAAVQIVSHVCSSCERNHGGVPQKALISHKLTSVQLCSW